MLPRRYAFLLLVPLGVITFGTVGYMILEGWSWFDSLYMTVMTITTVGYGEVHKLDSAGRAFTIVLMLSGIFTLFYAAGELIRAIVNGEMQSALGRYRMEQSLARLNYHVIVCGYGRMGRLVCQEFETGNVPYVVIDKGTVLTNFKQPHGIALIGDATSDDVLRQAGIDRARALVAVLGTDADNLFITMSARLLNEGLFIVARAENEHSIAKLQRAGANRSVSPYAIGGERVAGAVMRPAVVDFIELATRSEHMDLQIEETLVAPHSKLVGTVLKDSQLRQEYGLILVAIKKPEGAMIFNPPSETAIVGNDILITLGPRKQLDRLEALAKG